MMMTIKEHVEAKPPLTKNRQSIETIQEILLFSLLFYFKKIKKAVFMKKQE